MQGMAHQGDISGKGTRCRNELGQDLSHMPIANFNSVQPTTKYFNEHGACLVINLE